MSPDRPATKATRVYAALLRIGWVHARSKGARRAPLASARTGTRERPADRVLSLIGSLESGVADLAENHSAKILESLRRRMKASA